MIMLADEEFDVADQVLEIPLDRIHPAVDNTRTEDLAKDPDMPGLVESIKAVGVLQPITVVRRGDGDFDIMYGARRHYASGVAGCSTIKSIVRDSVEDAARIKEMVIENARRRDLNVIDEARAFRRLRDDFGMTQEQIATECGYSQPVVAKRLSLLALPSGVQSKVAAHEVSQNDALELVKLAEHPKRLKAALKAATGEWAWDMDRAVEHELTEIANDEALTETRTELKKRGINILHVQSGYGMSGPEADKRRKALDGCKKVVKPPHYAGSDALMLDKPAQHAKEPCHAVTLLVANGKVERTAYCTEPKRHAARGDSSLKAAAAKKTTSPDDQAKAQRAENKARREGQAATEANRTAFLNAHLTHPIDAALEEKLIAAVTVSFVGQEFDDLSATYRYNRLKDLLGADPGEYAATSREHLIRAALLAQLLLEDRGSGYELVGPLHQALGYQPTEFEHAEVARLSVARAATAALDAGATFIDRAHELGEDESTVGDFYGPYFDELENEAELTLERVAEIHAIFDCELTLLEERHKDGDRIAEVVAEAAIEERKPATEPEPVTETELDIDTLDALYSTQNRLLERAKDFDDGPDGFLEKLTELGSEIQLHQDEIEPITPTRARELTAEMQTLLGVLDQLELDRMRADTAATEEITDAFSLTVHAGADAIDKLAKAVVGEDIDPCPFPRCTLGAEHDGDHDGPDRVCPHPDCTLGVGHDGDHAVPSDENAEARAAPAPDVEDVDDQASTGHAPEGAAPPLLTEYAESAADIGTTEYMCRDLITALPADHDEVAALQQELFAGSIERDRAHEIYRRIYELTNELGPQDYVAKAKNGSEARCRSLIADLPADDPRVRTLQLELYRGISVGRAQQVRKELVALKSELAKEQSE